MTKTANEQVLDATVRHQIKLLRFSEGQAQKAASLLAKSDEELVKLLESGLTDVTRARAVALLKDVRRMRAATVESLGSDIQSDMASLASSESSWEGSMMQGSLPIAVTFNSVSPTILKAVATSPISGAPLMGWLGKMAENDAFRIEQQINLGMLQGETIEQMIGRIRGTKAAGYADGVLNITRREAATIARTAANHVSSAARQATWDANADIISGVIWVSTLDGRTSPSCQSRDGQIYPLNEGPRPPGHLGCRSTVAPVLKGEAVLGNRPTVSDTRTRAQREIDFRADAKAAAGDKWKTMSASDRTDAIKSMRTKWADDNIGFASTKTNYESWLKGQSTAFQDDVLGPGKAKLFRSGTPLGKFVDAQGKPYTLAQLQAEVSGDKLFVTQPGVGLKAKALLQQGMTSEQVLTQIKLEFPEASTSAASIASYKSELNKAGLLNLPLAQIPSTAMKQASSVADTVALLDSSLPANVKHAIGGQWSTVVDTLEGSPGAYGYYQAGKGVILSGSKLASVSAVQAQQIAAHELGHLLHKQHGLTLPTDVIDSMKKAAKNLSTEGRKMYSYYLSHIDELLAEVYSQALSPSPMTSQGIVSLEFRHAFGSTIQATKDAMALKFPMPSALAKPLLPGGPTAAFEVAGKHTSVGSLAKALLQQGMPDKDVLTAVLAEFPTAKTKMASIQSYKSVLKKESSMSLPGIGPVVNAKVLPDIAKVPLSAEVAAAIPQTVSATPSLVKLSGAELKLKGLDLMKQGVMGNADIAGTLDKLYPLNAGQAKATTVATWKSLWKKSDPKGYAAALDKASTVSAKVAKLTGDIPKPALFDAKLGPVSTKALNKVQSVLAAGGSKAECFEALKSIFGSLQEPGASNMIELAQYRLATAKAVGKPYMSASASTGFKAFKPVEVPGGPSSAKQLEYGVTEAMAKNPAAVNLVAEMAKATAHTQNILYMDIKQMSNPVAIKMFEAFKDGLKAGMADAQVAAKFKAETGILITPGMAADYKALAAIDHLNKVGKLKPGAVALPGTAPVAAKSGVVKLTASEKYANYQQLLERNDPTIQPARLAATPRDGLPPPPRFTNEQRLRAVEFYNRGGGAPVHTHGAINPSQRALGLEELTREEGAALRLYTGHAYKELNAALRRGTYASDPFLQAYVEAAQHGLAKMPKYTGVASRGISLSAERLETMLTVYREGAVVEDAAFVSSSVGHKPAFGGNVLVRIKSKTGVNVSQFSAYPDEQEVLFMPGTRFKVAKISVEPSAGIPGSTTKHIIELEEI